MLIYQLIFINILFLSGAFFNQLIARNLSLLFVMITGLLSGFVIWVIIGLLILLIGLPLSIGISISFYCALLAFFIFEGIQKKAFDRKFFIWLLLTILCISILTSFFIINNYSTGFFDSLLLITQGKNLVLDGLSKFYESSPRGFGIFIPILQAGSAFCKASYLPAVQPMMSVSFIFSFIFLIYKSAQKIYAVSKIFLISIILFVVFFLTNQFIVFNLPLILTNFPTAIYFFFAISTYWLSLQGNNKKLLILTTMSLIAIALLRTEGPVFGIVFLTIMLSEKTWSYMDRLKFSVPYLILVIIWYARIYFIQEIKFDIVNSDTILLIIGAHVLLLVFIIFTKYSLLNKLLLQFHWFTLLGLSAFIGIYFIFHFSHGVILIGNILLPMFIWGGWGLFYLFIFVFFILASFMPVFKNEKGLIFIIVTFYLLLLVLEIVSGSYRITGSALNKWSGSGNRISIQIIPIVIYYFVLKFGTLFNKNFKITDGE